MRAEGPVHTEVLQWRATVESHAGTQLPDNRHYCMREYTHTQSKTGHMM